MILKKPHGFPRLPTLVRASVAVFIFVFAAAANAQRDLKDIPVPDPELERATFVLPPGFEVNLFAADPAIAKPIQMNFDPQGRLWIVSSSVYPHIEPGQQATDKVLVLEDTDGDGRSDQTHIFAEGLLIPTAIVPGDQGAYVGASTELLHFRDTDGDLKADQERVVLSGFGTEDTHHIIHTLRWGPAQRLYFNQSIYIHSHIETPWGVRRLDAGGIWQFRPDDLRLNVFARGLVNPWGTAFDAYGTTFATDGAGGEGINYIVPGASYATAKGASRILHGLNPGSPKHCGLEIIYSSHLPEAWQGSFLTNDFRGHRVCRFVLQPYGSGFLSQEKQELIKSDHVAFRPVDVKLGPDGAIYIADWYNPIIQHGEVDFRDPRRDHVHGRIWRVTYRGRPLVPRVDLTSLSTPELIQQLASPNRWTRSQAKRVLKERGPGVLSDLQAWLAKQEKTDRDVTQLRLEALWMHLAFDVPNEELLRSLLNSRNPDARAAATRILGDWRDRLPHVLDWLEARVADRAPRVRLEAVRVLGKIPQRRSIEIATRALDPPVAKTQKDDAAASEEFVFDEWLDYALWLTAQDLQPVWEPALARGELTLGGDGLHLAFLLRSLESVHDPETLPALMHRLEQGRIPATARTEALNAISRLGKADSLRLVYDLAVKTKDSDLVLGYLDALLNAAQSRGIKPAHDPNSLQTLLERDAPAIRARVAELVGIWKETRFAEQLFQLAQSSRQPDTVRYAAIQGIANLGGGQAVRRLKQIAGDHPQNAYQRAAVIGLVSINLPEAAKLAAVFLSETKQAADAQSLLKAFLSRPKGADRLAEQIHAAAQAGRRIAPDVAVLGLREIRASGLKSTKLEDALSKAGGVSKGPVQLSADEMARMVEEVKQKGDPHRGEAIYRRQDLACQRCHAIGDAGGLVGPNLRSLGATAQIDYIIQSLLDPNAKLKEGYHTLVVINDAGKQFAGIKLRQTDTAVILRDAEGRELSIPLDSIDIQTDGASLMPSGLTEKLTRQELLDLIAFLSALGRIPEYTITPDNLARKWHMLQATPKAAHQLRRTSYAQAALDDPHWSWQTVYSSVSGQLPLHELDAIRVRNRLQKTYRGIAFVRTEIDVAKAGLAILKINTPAGLQVWLDEKPLSVDQSTQVEFQQGVHRLTISIDLSTRQQDLRMELVPARQSQVVARFVGGQ